jgi:hypothetical protein
MRLAWWPLWANVSGFLGQGGIGITRLGGDCECVPH